MNNIYDLVASLPNRYVKVDLTKLPSQGFFYKDDFEIYIRSLSVEEIEDFNNKVNVSFSSPYDETIYYVKEIHNIIKKCSSFSKKYKILDIKATDIVFLFLLIVELTNKEPITVSYLEDGIEKLIKISPETYNYYDFTPLLKFYNNKKKHFTIEGYNMCLHSIGIENSIVKYYSSDKKKLTFEYLEKCNNNFLLFMKNKNSLKISELDNIIEFFNSDISDDEREKIDNLSKLFDSITSYSLLTEDKKVVTINYLDIKNIFKKV